MKKQGPQSIASLLNQTPDTLIEQLAAQQAENDTLIHTIKANLPSNLSEQLVGASIRSDILILVASSPAWANLIRYHTHKLTQTLESTHPKIQKVIIRATADHTL